MEINLNLGVFSSTSPSQVEIKHPIRAVGQQTGAVRMKPPSPTCHGSTSLTGCRLVQTQNKIQQESVGLQQTQHTTATAGQGSQALHRLALANCHNRQSLSALVLVDLEIKQEVAAAHLALAHLCAIAWC